MSNNFNGGLSYLGWRLFGMVIGCFAFQSLAIAQNCPDCSVHTFAFHNHGQGIGATVLWMRMRSETGIYTEPSLMKETDKVVVLEHNTFPNFSWEPNETLSISHNSSAKTLHVGKLGGILSGGVEVGGGASADAGVIFARAKAEAHCNVNFGFELQTSGEDHVEEACSVTATFVVQPRKEATFTKLKTEHYRKYTADKQDRVYCVQLITDKGEWTNCGPITTEWADALGWTNETNAFSTRSLSPDEQPPHPGGNGSSGG